MHKFLLLSLLFAGLYVHGQKKADPKSFANSITSDDLRKHMYIVAGPEMEGRETATEGQRKAAAYIENYFKTIGLLPGSNGTFQME